MSHFSQQGHASSFNSWDWDELKRRLEQLYIECRSMIITMGSVNLIEVTSTAEHLPVHCNLKIDYFALIAGSETEYRGSMEISKLNDVVSVESANVHVTVDDNGPLNEKVKLLMSEIGAGKIQQEFTKYVYEQRKKFNKDPTSGRSTVSSPSSMNSISFLDSVIRKTDSLHLEAKTDDEKKPKVDANYPAAKECKKNPSLATPKCYEVLIKVINNLPSEVFASLVAAVPVGRRADRNEQLEPIHHRQIILENYKEMYKDDLREPQRLKEWVKSELKRLRGVTLAEPTVIKQNKALIDEWTALAKKVRETARCIENLNKRKELAVVAGKSHQARKTQERLIDGVKKENDEENEENQGVSKNQTIEGKGLTNIAGSTKDAHQEEELTKVTNSRIVTYELPTPFPEPSDEPVMPAGKMLDPSVTSSLYMPCAYDALHPDGEEQIIFENLTDFEDRDVHLPTEQQIDQNIDDNKTGKPSTIEKSSVKDGMIYERMEEKFTTANNDKWKLEHSSPQGSSVRNSRSITGVAVNTSKNQLIEGEGSNGESFTNTTRSTAKGEQTEGFSPLKHSHIVTYELPTPFPEPSDEPVMPAGKMLDPSVASSLYMPCAHDALHPDGEEQITYENLTNFGDPDVHLPTEQQIVQIIGRNNERASSHERSSADGPQSEKETASLDVLEKQKPPHSCICQQQLIQLQAENDALRNRVEKLEKIVSVQAATINSLTDIGEKK